MRVYTESCIQLRLIDVKISQLAIKVSAREWIGGGGATFAGVGERPTNPNLLLTPSLNVVISITFRAFVATAKIVRLKILNSFQSLFGVS